MATEILVARRKDLFSSILIEQGFTVTNFPTIKTEPLEDLSELENCLKKIENFDGIFITSSTAAEILLAKLNQAQTRFHGKIFILGGKSLELFENTGVEIFFNEQANNVGDLLELIPAEELKGKRFLFPCGTRSLRVIPEKLGKIADVREVVVYKTIATDEVKTQSDEIKEKLKSGQFAAVCFFSPSGVEGFLGEFDGFRQNNIKIAVIGKTTAAYAKDNNLKVHFISAKPTAEVFAQGLTEYLRKEI